jgi:ribosomal protein S18 acetylase RimI-like enzyme
MTTPGYVIRRLELTEWSAVALLIRDSTNAWYLAHGQSPIFTGPVDATLLFPQVYEALDPGCCAVAIDTETQELLGSCFYHPRATHVSLGIMNVSPHAMGRGIASRLLREVIDVADAASLPIRLVSSAQNLDSFSLYTRQGFTARMVFQDMLLPSTKLATVPCPKPADVTIRPATKPDLPQISVFEQARVGISRPQDYEYFLKHPEQGWQTFVAMNSDEQLLGFLVGIQHAGSTMLGPGLMCDEQIAAALIHVALQARPDWSPVILVPAHAGELVRTLYQWGARNLELHLLQVRGHCPTIQGIWLPTFMPETG